MSSEGIKSKKLAIIDGKSVFYRGYYAMPNLATKDGTSTGGVFGFATMALEVIRRLKPDYVAVAWDKPKTNIRKRLALYPEYKAGRKPAPPDFYEQIPVLHELLQAFGWPLYELDDYEADDIMGTLAIQAAKQGIDTMLVTSDLDMLQLVDPHVHVYALKKGLSNIELYSPVSFEAKYHIAVEQFIDLKALKGDSSDNIPGVPGIGEKTAIGLLQQFKTLDAIYDNLDLIKDSVRQKLEAGRELAYISKKLGAIWTDAPLKLDIKSLDGSNVHPEKIRELLQKLEFRSLLRQLPEVMQVQQVDETSVSEDDLKRPTNILITSDDQLAQVEFGDPSELIVSSRSAGNHGRNPQLLALSPNPKTVYSFDLTRLSIDKTKDLLGPLLADPNIAKIGYDVKSTIKALLSLELEFNNVGHDVLIGEFLINPLNRNLSLTDIAITNLGYDGSSLEDLDKDELIQKMPELIAVIRGLYQRQTQELNSVPKLLGLARDIEWPLIPVLARMEYEGIKLDTKYLSNFSTQLEDSISDLEQQIYGYADQEFNISSPSQLAEILFNKLKLPTQGIKKSKTGYSTAVHELDKLRGEHPIIDLISQYREAVKLKNTYVDTLPTQVDERSRIHTTFNLTVAQTGRLSSANPNLQNIPTRTDLGRHIRSAFVAEAGNRLVSADYSQFELRLAAFLADDKELVEMFNRDVDVHTATAAQISGRELEDVTKQMRSAAKVVNFGVLYGMSPHGLSAATGMTHEQAQNFIEQYFELRKPLLTYMNELKQKARKDGYVESLLGRRRPTPDIESSNFVVRSSAERAAINMPIQGTEADLTKLAMIAVDHKLKEQHNDCKMLLQIHDSILVECPSGVAERVAGLLKETMENIYDLPVKLTVDTSIGQNWGEL